MGVKESKRIFDPIKTDNRTFEQQMRDLNVEVVRPTVVWNEPVFHRKGLHDCLSITENGITLGKEIAEKINAERLDVGVMERTQKKPTVALRPSKKGYKVCKKTSCYRLGSPKLIRWLRERGIELGVYEVKEIKGGYVAYKL